MNALLLAAIVLLIVYRVVLYVSPIIDSRYLVETLALGIIGLAIIGSTVAVFALMLGCFRG